MWKVEATDFYVNYSTDGNLLLNYTIWSNRAYDVLTRDQKRDFFRRNFVLGKAIILGQCEGHTIIEGQSQLNSLWIKIFHRMWWKKAISAKDSNFMMSFWQLFKRIVKQQRTRSTNADKNKKTQRKRHLIYVNIML